jgi:integrase
LLESASVGTSKRSPGGEQADKRPKRSHGEGNIYKRADGLFVGRIMLGRKPNGRPDRPKVIGSTRAAVLKQIAELRRQADEGTVIDAGHSRQTVAAYLGVWLDAAGTTTRPQTLVGYRQIVRDHITPSLGRYKLSALRPDAIQRLYAAKLAEGLSAYTVRKIHIVLHRALEVAVRWRYLPRNPADDVDPPTASKRDVRPPEPAELTRLVEAAEAAQDRLAALWALAIYTGCRQGELLALGWTDVDMELATLSVRRNLIQVKNQTPLFGAPKSETSRRTISLPVAAVAALRAHKARQAEERLAAAHWADCDLVFCSAIGTPLLRRNINRSFSLALKRAGLRATIRFHDLRHAHATLMLRAGVPLKVASGRLGHGSVAITADLYQHWASDMDTDAAERAASAMSVIRSTN